MTLVTLRPNATTSNTAALTGGATAHAVLSDNSDASYITYDDASDDTLVGLDDLTLPANAVVKSVNARVRGAILTGNPGGIINSTYLAPPNYYYYFQPFASTTPTTFTYPFEAGWTDALIDAVVMELRVNVGNGTGRIHEFYFDVRYVTQPTLTVTAPTGTYTTTNTPTVAWTRTLDSDGGAQTNYEVKVYTAAQYGAGGFSPDTSPSTWGSGIIAAADVTKVIGTPLANATYRAYVRIAQTVNGTALWSAWAFSGFVINVTPPNVPILALTAESNAGRVAALITSGGGATTTDRVELQRSIDAGTTWVAVRNTETNDGTITYPAAPITVRDYEAPNGTVASYRVRAIHDFGSGLLVTGAWSSTGTVTWTSTDWWLKHPNIPALNLKLPNMTTTSTMRSYSKIARKARVTNFQPLGATTPIRVSDTRAADQGVVTLRLNNLTDQNKFVALLDALSTVLLQGPVADGHPARYIGIDDSSSERVIDQGWSALTFETFGWTEQTVPGGVIIGADWA